MVSNEKQTLTYERARRTHCLSTETECVVPKNSPANRKQLKTEYCVFLCLGVIACRLPRCTHYYF